MERCTIADAAVNFNGLVSRVVEEGITVELERDNHVVARLSPVPPSRLTVSDLAAVLAQLPRLGDDAEAFARDLEAIRAEARPDGDPWD
jgi:antitoxin (DNA-binding transcriptional repressor) of toxin-antitoxin stability system